MQEDLKNEINEIASQERAKINRQRDAMIEILSMNCFKDLKSTHFYITSFYTGFVIFYKHNYTLEFNWNPNKCFNIDLKLRVSNNHIQNINSVVLTDNGYYQECGNLCKIPRDEGEYILKGFKSICRDLCSFIKRPKDEIIKEQITEYKKIISELNKSLNEEKD